MYSSEKRENRSQAASAHQKRQGGYPNAPANTMLQAMANNSEQSQRLQAYQEMADKRTANNGMPLQMKSVPAQLYKIREDDLKESSNGELLLAGDKDLYASETMISQANSIPKSQVEFEKKSSAKENSSGIELTAVWPQIKEGGELKKNVDYFKDFDKYTDGVTNVSAEADLKSLIRMMKEKLFKEEALEKIRLRKEKLEQERLEQEKLKPKEDSDSSDDSDSEDDLDELEIEIDLLAEESPQLLANQNIYNELVRATIKDDETLFPTDCGWMADYVSGQKTDIFDTGGKKDATGQGPAAGQAYHLIANNHKDTDDQNEWESHHAAIIMVDGDDHITLEGAKHKTSDDFLKATFDTSWFFRMYGSAEEQTFEDEYKNNFAPGYNITKTKQK